MIGSGLVCRDLTSIIMAIFSAAATLFILRRVYSGGSYHIDVFFLVPFLIITTFFFISIVVTGRMYGLRLFLTAYVILIGAVLFSNVRSGTNFFFVLSLFKIILLFSVIEYLLVQLTGSALSQLIGCSTSTEFGYVSSRNNYREYLWFIAPPNNLNTIFGGNQTASIFHLMALFFFLDARKELPSVSIGWVYISLFLLVVSPTVTAFIVGSAVMLTRYYTLSTGRSRLSRALVLMGAILFFPALNIILPFTHDVTLGEFITKIAFPSVSHVFSDNLTDFLFGYQLPPKDSANEIYFAKMISGVGIVVSFFTLVIVFLVPLSIIARNKNISNSYLSIFLVSFFSLIHYGSVINGPFFLFLLVVMVILYSEASAYKQSV